MSDDEKDWQTELGWMNSVDPQDEVRITRLVKWRVVAICMVVFLLGLIAGGASQ